MKVIKRLSQKNADISASASITIAFLGDSVTQGCFELHKGYNCVFSNG